MSNSTLFGRFLEGDGLELVIIPETESQAGLAWVKAKTLVRARWLGRFRVSGLSGLSSGKTKTSPQAGFTLIPQPRLG
jgi:hypothetical protein